MTKLAISCLIAFSQLFNIIEGTDLALRNRMNRDLDFYKNAFEVKYAPAEWKKSYAGWDLDTEIEIAKAKIDQENPITNKEYQRIVKGFFNSTKDYHVAIHFFSTEAATLPFMVKSANGKYFFSHINNEAFTEQTPPFEVGDELLSFDGRPIDKVVSELKDAELPHGSTSTDQCLAEIFLTKRFGSAGMHVPKGAIAITVKNKNKKQFTCNLNWSYIPELIKTPTQMASVDFSAPDLSKSQNLKTNQNSPLKKNPLLSKQMATPLFQYFLNPQTGKLEDENPHSLGSRESFLPALGKKLWTDNDSSFDAYTYQNNEGRRIGYIRIPHYSGSDWEAEEFFGLITQFEKETDALIIDQLNNPGGSVFYLYALSSILSSKPLVVPKHRLSITQEEVTTALVLKFLLEDVSTNEEAIDLLGNSIDGYPVTYELTTQLVSYFSFIIDQWEQGNFLTEATYLYGIDKIKPIKDPFYRPFALCYTKPILFLINSLDFSGGDFMPAILQDNARITVMGSRTAGAGGILAESSHPNRFGIKQFAFTGSIAERLNGQPIENLGVTPDIEYQITEADLQKNYQEYVQAIRNTINKMAARKRRA